MSEHSTPEERTEMPTDRRMQHLRKEGQVHMSSELVQTSTLISGFIILGMVWSWLFDIFKIVFRSSFRLIAENQEFTLERLRQGFFGLLMLVAPALMIIFLVVAAAAILSVMLQTNWNVKEKKIHFRFGALNPIGGLSRIFSIQGVVNTLKALLKLSIILPIGYFALRGFAPKMISLIHTTVMDVMFFTGDAMRILFWKIAAVLIVLAIFDFFWTKFQWLKQNKMTKEEVKDERKAIEGDEQTKKKIISKGLQRIMQRIMTSVPKADVVITNPTHIAVALKYDRNSMVAPTVVAKGKGFLAERIMAIARKSGVPVIQRKPLARALFASTEVGTEIPRELFKAVAEILAYVYRLKNPWAYRSTSSSTGANT